MTKTRTVVAFHLGLVQVHYGECWTEGPWLVIENAEGFMRIPASAILSAATTHEKPDEPTESPA